MVNKVILIGHVGADPEIRTTQSQQPVATFSLATSRRWKDESGERQEHTELHNLVAFGNRAGGVGDYVK